MDTDPFAGIQSDHDAAVDRQIDRTRELLNLLDECQAKAVLHEALAGGDMPAVAALATTLLVHVARAGGYDPQGVDLAAANEQLGQALTEARAENEALRAELARAKAGPTDNQPTPDVHWTMLAVPAEEGTATFTDDSPPPWLAPDPSTKED